MACLASLGIVSDRISRGAAPGGIGELFLSGGSTRQAAGRRRMAGCQSTGILRTLESISGPIFVRMTNTDHKNAPVIVDLIDN